MLEKWRAASDEVNATTPPTIPTVGTDGYPQDKAPGVKGTPVKAWWHWMIHQELATLVSQLGGAFGAGTTSLRDAVAYRLRGIVSGPGATGTAAGTAAVCLGGQGCTAPGTRAATLGGLDCDATGSQSTTIGGAGQIASGLNSCGLHSLNIEVGDDHTVGWGTGASKPTPSGANQNLTGRINTDTGDVAFGGKTRFGGDPNDAADTTNKAEIDGADGSARFDGPVQASRIVMPAGSSGNRHGTTSFTGLTVAAGAESPDLSVAVAGMGLTAKVQVTVAYRNGGAPITVETASGEGGFTWKFENGGSTECTRVDINWHVTDVE